MKVACDIRLVDNQRLAGTALAIALLLTACAAPPMKPSAVPVPSRPLLSSGTLHLPSGCEPTQGVVYRTTFTVQANGRVTEAASGSGEGCVQDALRDWVATFLYQADDAATPTAIDWMGVTGSRGG